MAVKVSPSDIESVKTGLFAYVNDAEPPPLHRTNLNSQVYDTLINWIVTRKLKARQKLSIADIAQKLNVSRSPVHQALTRLVSDSFVTVSQRQGYYVAPITTDTVLNAFDVRLALELMAAERSVGQVSVERLAELRRLMQETLATVEDDGIVNKTGYLVTNWTFHWYQVSLANNALMARYYESLKVHLLMGRIISKRNAGMRHVVIEHANLVEAFEAADLRGVQQVIRNHIKSGIRVAMEEISAAGGDL